MLSVVHHLDKRKGITETRIRTLNGTDYSTMICMIFRIFLEHVTPDRKMVRTFRSRHLVKVVRDQWLNELGSSPLWVYVFNVLHLYNWMSINRFLLSWDLTYHSVRGLGVLSEDLVYLRVDTHRANIVSTPWGLSSGGTQRIGSRYTEDSISWLLVGQRYSRNLVSVQ